MKKKKKKTGRPDGPAQAMNLEFSPSDCGTFSPGKVFSKDASRCGPFGNVCVSSTFLTSPLLITSPGSCRLRLRWGEGQANHIIYSAEKTVYSHHVPPTL
jgi:hypothetical protein